MLVLPESLLDSTHPKQSGSFQIYIILALKITRFTETILTKEFSIILYFYWSVCFHIFFEIPISHGPFTRLSYKSQNKQDHREFCLPSVIVAIAVSNWNCGCLQNSNETATGDENNENAILKTILKSWFRNFRAKVCWVLNNGLFTAEKIFSILQHTLSKSSLLFLTPLWHLRERYKVQLTDS